MPQHQSQTMVVWTSRGLSIAGTRITLYDIMDYVRADWPLNLIRQRFDLSDQQITEVMAYIAAHREEVEAEYQFVLEQAETTRAYWEEHNRERLAKIGQLPRNPARKRRSRNCAPARPSWACREADPGRPQHRRSGGAGVECPEHRGLVGPGADAVGPFYRREPCAQRGVIARSGSSSKCIKCYC